MKPGNLRERKVPNPAKQSKDEDGEPVPCRFAGRVALFRSDPRNTERMRAHGKSTFYF